MMINVERISPRQTRSVPDVDIEVVVYTLNPRNSNKFYAARSFHSTPRGRYVSYT